jgi:hypothetical protein
MVTFGSGHYTTNQSFINPVDGSSFDDEFSVSAKGCGSGCTYVTYTGPTAIPVFNRPTGGANFTSMQIADMTIDGGAAASAAIELGTLGQSYFTNLAAGHIAPGSDHVIEFGHFGGDAFQVFPANINIGVYPDTGTQNCGNFTANVVGGAITSYTVKQWWQLLCHLLREHGADGRVPARVQGRHVDPAVHGDAHGHDGDHQRERGDRDYSREQQRLRLQRHHRRSGLPNAKCQLRGDLQ